MKHVLLLSVLLLLIFLAGCGPEYFTASPKISNLTMDSTAGTVSYFVTYDTGPTGGCFAAASIKGWYRRPDEASSVRHTINFAQSIIKSRSYQFVITGYEGDTSPEWAPLPADTWYYFEVCAEAEYVSTGTDNSDTYNFVKSTTEDWTYHNGVATLTASKVVKSIPSR